MKLTIKLKKPQNRKPSEKTIFAEYRSDTRPQSRRKEPKVTPYEFWYQHATHNHYVKRPGWTLSSCQIVLTH
jgi:hypothetical protein